ncbi:hypothetical protein QR680_008311 [Steinernema hermaphroditum]|uniref:Granulins domain-containing protein n=1 Tax=Steinernema hermaphroditum TaxID=289476 RepID=A0AA39M7M7_9BILA|nr:hypothetical protein QR680_008311 [Steinernema hermaphroditum]
MKSFCIVLLLLTVVALAASAVQEEARGCSGTQCLPNFCCPFKNAVCCKGVNTCCIAGNICKGRTCYSRPGGFAQAFTAAITN